MPCLRRRRGTLTGQAGAASVLTAPFSWVPVRSPRVLSPQPGGRSVTRPPGLQSQVPGGLSGPFLSPQVGTAVGSARTYATVGELLCRIVPVCGSSARGLVAGPAATPSKSAPVGCRGPEACCRAPRLRGRPTDTRAGLARL